MKARLGLKALIALGGVLVGAVATVLVGNDWSLDGIDAEGWLYIAGAVLTSGALVAFVTNVPGVLGGAIKAIVASAAAFVASLTAAYQVDQLLNPQDYLAAASVALLLLAGTYETDEGPPPTA